MFLTGLDRVLNDSGVRWTARAGWQTRTAHRGGLREVRAVMWHTTETGTASFRRSTVPTLGYVQSGLGYPLYNILIGRDGHAYLIAAGTSAHAGKGTGHGMPRDQGNYYSIGVSFDSNNNTTPINTAQLETGARIGAAFDREWKGNLRHVMHGEWAPTRRSDPTKVPGGWSALRAAIKRGYWKTSSTPSTTPTPSNGGSTVSAEDVWTYRGTDYVNDNNNTQQAKLARAHQYSYQQPTRVWGHRGLDYVNENPTTKNSQLARTHQYTFETRSDVRELKAMVEVLAEQLDGLKGGLADAVKQAKQEVANVTAAEVAAELEVDIRVTEQDQED